MKRSEMNRVFRGRVEFSSEYDCVSCQMYDGNGDKCTHSGSNGDECQCEPQENFSHSGCDICPGHLAATVTDIVFLAKADIKKSVFDKIYEGQLCGGCLCSIVNGDDSDLDYSTTDEDEPKAKGY